MDALTARLLCNNSQANSYKQQKHMEITHHLVCWDGIQYDSNTYCGCLQHLLAKWVDETNVAVPKLYVAIISIVHSTTTYFLNSPIMLALTTL